MISYTQYVNRFNNLAKNNATNTNTIGAQLINDSLRYLTTKFYFNERSYSVPGGTVAQQQFYNAPPQLKELINLTVSIGSVIWVPKVCPTREYWDALNVITFYQDFPSFFYLFNNQVGIFPIPASNGNPITINYQIRLTDLSQADYVTGTVSTPYTTTLTGAPSLGAISGTLSGNWTLPTGIYYVVFSDGENRNITFTNGATTATWSGGITGTPTSTLTVSSASGGSIITGASGASWTTSMAGRWIQISNANSNTTAGDNQWYPIASVIDSTHLSLKNIYTGTAVSGGSYTIGEMPILAEDHQDLALYRALWIYFTSRVPNPTNAKLYKELYDEGYKILDAEFGQKTTNVELSDTQAPVYNPNLFATTLTQS